MTKSRSIGRNSSFINIRKAHSKNVLSDTNGHEKVEAAVIDIEALRAIRRIVRPIKQRIEAGEAAGAEKCPAGDLGGPGTTSPNCSQNTNPESAKNP